jgi:hypothetical protein
LKKAFAVIGMAGVVAASLVAPAKAAEQTGTQTIDATVSSSFTMSLSDATVGTSGAPWVLAASGPNAGRAAGTLSVSANSAYTVTVQAQRATLTEFDGTAYIAPTPRSLASATSLTTTLSSGLGVGTPATPVLSAAPTVIATGGLASDVFTLSMAQPTTVADATLPAGRTYHNLFTYTGTSAL